MGKKVENMIGRRFGRYVVLEETKERKKDGTIKYLCRCDCGNERIVSGSLLRSGQSKSCGCYNRDVVKKENPNYKKPLYGILNSMKQRCNNKNDKAYHNYGARGIRVCEEWAKDFNSFEEWAINNGYRNGLWIDRIDDNGNYEPNNCRWATPKEQQNNKRTNVMITINGETKNIEEWSNISGIGWATIKRRIELGWENENLLKPVQKKYSHSEKIKEGIRSSRR